MACATAVPSEVACPRLISSPGLIIHKSGEVVRVAVTGGAGFIGANLVGELLERDAEVVVIDDLSTGYRENLAAMPQAKLFKGSVLDADLLDAALAGVDSIVHLAAVPSVPRSIAAPEGSHDANATGTLRVLEAARRAGGVHTIVASSSSVYGANPTLPKSEDLRPQPLSPYAVSKLAAESYALAYQHVYGLSTLAFRFFNVFGPLQAPGHAYAAVIPTFLDAAMRDVPMPVHGDGEQTRDFTYVGTVTAVIADALERTVVASDPVNLAFGTRRSLNEVIAEMERQLELHLSIDRQPRRPGDVRHSQADQARLLELFPHVAPTDFEDGLAETIKWFRRRRANRISTAVHGPTVYLR
jgi:UDP-glucose 4-epimerase